MHKIVAFLYISNELWEKEIKKIIQFTVSSKRIKHLEINLTKEVKDLYSENFKTLMKEIEDDTNKWNIILCSLIGRINMIKMSLWPKEIYRFNAISIKIPIIFFTWLEQIVLKLVWNQKRAWIAKAILRKKNKAWGIMFPDLRLYYKATIIKIVWYWHIKQTPRPMEQNRGPRNKPIHLWSVHLQQSRQEYTVGENSLFNKWH